MFEASNRQAAKRDRSLLSLGHADSTPAGHPRPGDPMPRKPAASLLGLAGGQGEPDPALRHRMARSRREAHQSPLLSALATGNGHEPRAEQPSALAADDAGKSSPAERLAGWAKRLFGSGRSAPAGASVGRTQAPDMHAARRESEPQPGSAAAPEPVLATRASPELRTPPAAEPASPPRASTTSQRRSILDRREEPAEAGEDTTGNRQDYWQPLIDPFKVIGGIGKSRWLILATTIVGALIGVMVALSTPKQYEAYTELVVDPRDLKLTERELTTTGLPSDATLALVENQARVITSSLVLNKVVDKLNLAEDPEFNGEAGGGFGLRSAIGLIRSLLSGSDATVDEGRRHSLAVEHLGQSLTVERGTRTFVIVISVKTREPEKSALIANTMTEVFMQISGELQADTAGRATDELVARLDELRKGLEQAERKVAAFKAEHDIVDPQGRLITDDEIVKVNDQLSVAKARTIELNARAATARGVTAAAAASGALPEEIASPVMTELRAQYAAAKSEADRLASRLGPRHPTRLAADAQVAGALDRIAGELRRISSSLQVDLQRAIEQEQDLASRLAQLKVRQGGIGDDLVTLRELEREASAKRAVYEAFLLRARETAEQRGINAANVSVISPAYPPLDPTGPGRSTIAAAGTVLGFLFGVGLGAVRGGWESLRDNMAARPRRRRSAAVAKPDGEPPRTPPPGGRKKTFRDTSETRDTPATGEGKKKMGLFNWLRRGPEPAPTFASAPAYGQPQANYAPPQAYAPPPPVPAVPLTYPVAPTASPAYGWQPAPQPPLHPAAPAAHAGWPVAPHPSAHPGWAPAPPPPAHPWHQPFAAAPAPMHPAYAQAPLYGAPQMQPVGPAPIQTWPAAGAWQPAPPPAYALPPVYVVASQPPPAPEPAYPARPEPARRPAAQALQPGNEYSAMDEIRDSLREFREAVQGLAEQRRRYS